MGFAISAVREECEFLSVEKENENARITTHDPTMGVTNWRLEEEELQVLCSINTNSTIDRNILHRGAAILYLAKV